MLRVPCHIREVENAVVGGRAHCAFNRRRAGPSDTGSLGLLPRESCLGRVREAFSLVKVTGHVDGALPSYTRAAR